MQPAMFSPRSGSATLLLANRRPDSGPSKIPCVLNPGQGPASGRTPELTTASPLLALHSPAEQPQYLGTGMPAGSQPSECHQDPAPAPAARKGQMKPSCPGWDRHHAVRATEFEGCLPKLLKNLTDSQVHLWPKSMSGSLDSNKNEKHSMEGSLNFNCDCTKQLKKIIATRLSLEKGTVCGKNEANLDRKSNFPPN